MECPFCGLLKDFIGQYVRIGVVCNCDTNDHIYRDGFIKKTSFSNNTIKLYDSPIRGNVIFTACCDDIFEVYFFGIKPSEAFDKNKIIDVETMIEQRRSLLKSAQGILHEEESANE